MAFRAEPEFGELLGRLAQALAERSVPFMVIGGQAVLVHGEPRLTQDIDVTVGVDVDRLPDILAALDSAELVPLPAEVADFVQETMVLPASDPATRLRVDLVFSHTPYERGAVERAIQVEVAGVQVPFASAEDLLLHKLFAGRPRDLEDAAGVVRRKGRHLDWGYIRRWAADFSRVPGREQMPDQVAHLEREAGAPG